MSAYASVKEMRRMFHNPAYSKIVIYFYKPISAYLTRILLPLPLSANFWTSMILVLTLAAAATLALGGYINQVIGILLLHAAFMTDVFDGEIAQYRQTFSARGKFLDYLGHGAFPIIYLGLGVGLMRTTGNQLFLYEGIAAMYFHALCAHNRWAYLRTVSESTLTTEVIKTHDGRIKKTVRLLTMGNYEFEIGAVLLIFIVAGLSEPILHFFSAWLALKWLTQSLLFIHDLALEKHGKKINQSFSQ